MPNLDRIDNRWNRKTFQCKAVIETPKGRRNKFDYDPEYKMFSLGGLLPEGLSFPFDFGFIPSTLGADGDPLDVMILMEEPAHVGCLIDVRIIGVVEAEQTEGKKVVVNDRLIGVSIHSYEHEKTTAIGDVAKSVLDQVEQFFVSYNKSHGKKFKVIARKGPKRAAKLIGEGIALFSKKKKG